VVEGAGVGKVLAVIDVANEVSVVGVVTGVLVVVVGAFSIFFLESKIANAVLLLQKAGL